MNCKKKPISECFYLTKYRNKQKNFNPTNRPAVEKIATLFKDNNLWTNLFFFSDDK